MYKNRLLSCVFLLIGCASGLNATNPLAPFTPIAVTTSGNVHTVPVVSGISSGFMIACMDTNNDIQSSFSSHGLSWSTPTLVNNNSYTGAWVAGTTEGFVITYITAVPGYLTATPVSIFSNDNGNTWDSEVVIENSSTVNAPVVVFASSNGFMATWVDTNDYNAYSSFSSDHGGTWTTASQISTSGLVNSLAASVSGNADVLVTTWAQGDPDAYASVSTNNGTTWSTPVAITNTDDVAHDVFVSGNGTDFMAVWANTTHDGYASVSTDGGNTWSAPFIVTTNTVQDYTDLMVSWSSAGFVITWIGIDDNAYARFSPNNGADWSETVPITNDSSVAVSYSDSSVGFVSVSAVGDQCVFTWTSSIDQNVYASFSYIGGAPPTPSPHPHNTLFQSSPFPRPLF